MYANTSNIVLLLNMHFINKKLSSSEICCLLLYKFLTKYNSKSHERVEYFVMKSQHRVMYQKSRKKIHIANMQIKPKLKKWVVHYNFFKEQPRP